MNASLEMFRQRARAFGHWPEVEVIRIERDQFDDLPTVVYLTETSGSLRLLPTTGPTLSRVLFPEHEIPPHPLIWECSRFCADTHEDARHLIAKLGTWALALGVHTIVAAFDAPMLRVYRRLGIEVSVIAKRGDGVMLGTFPVSHEILARVQARAA